MSKRTGSLSNKGKVTCNEKIRRFQLAFEIPVLCIALKTPNTAKNKNKVQFPTHNMCQPSSERDVLIKISMNHTDAPFIAPSCHRSSRRQH